ncbi:MAG TPA: hypothetical protein VHT91_31955 [Kofleriaceae bacterium]|jgi:hypothetical protein|nr:hypothetical protein [Kofleriaceae bacterium]
MRRHESRTALDDAIARFQAEVQRLAVAVARTVVEQELARRRATLEPARSRKARPAPPTARQLELGFGKAPRPQLELPLAAQAAGTAAQPAGVPAEPPREGEPAGAPAAAAEPATGTAEPPPGRPAAGRGRTRWTRDTIISELATWLLSGTAIDAQFMTRHGPKGLVAAIRRVFGRFDAALNLAALHNARLYPEGPPVRGASAGRPAIAAAPHEAK